MDVYYTDKIYWVNSSKTHQFTEHVLITLKLEGLQAYKIIKCMFKIYNYDIIIIIIKT